MSRIAAVIVTYNRIELLRECIDAIRRQNTRCDILVVDNASTDGTSDWLDLQPDVRTLHLEINAGGAGGFSRGMEEAAGLGYDYIWIMDDDTIANPDSLMSLMTAAGKLRDDYDSLAPAQGPAEDDPAFGYIASKVLWTDGSPCKMNAVTYKKKPKDSEKVYEKDGLHSITAATFVSLLFERRAVMRNGLPIAEYFIWGDDKEYTLRLSAKYPCYICEDSTVTHKMASNDGSNIKTDDIERVPRYFYAYRNDLATARSIGAGAVFIYFAAFMLNTLRVIFSFYPGKGRRLKAMYSGMIKGLTFKPDIVYVKRINID